MLEVESLLNSADVGMTSLDLTLQVKHRREHPTFYSDDRRIILKPYKT
jgi:hypothetical protein